MHSKSRVRWSGPLEPFAAGLDAELARLGYTPAGTRRKLEAVAHLSCWLAEHGMTTDDIRDETITEFAAARRAGGYSSQLTGQSLAWMLGYLRELGAVRPAPVPGRRRAQGTCWIGSGRSWRTGAGSRPRHAALTWTRRAGSWRQPCRTARAARC